MVKFQLKHRRLTFSWAHIIAILGLVAVTYFVFAGTIYLSGGDFTYGYIAAAIAFVSLIAVFIVPQQLKGADSHVARARRWEKILIIASVPVYLILMIPVCHFWTVEASSRTISEDFTEAINESRRLFDDYSQYSRSRIAGYRQALGFAAADTAAAAGNLSRLGFDPDTDPAIQSANMVRVMELRLVSPNYESTRKNALAWIENANQGVSPWNVFLLGNTVKIKDAVKGWETVLTEMSLPEMTNEKALGIYGYTPSTFENYSTGASLSRTKLEKLEQTFVEFSFPSIIALVMVALLFGMLALPYLVQRRSHRAGYDEVLPFGKDKEEPDTFAGRIKHTEDETGMKFEDTPSPPPVKNTESADIKDEGDDQFPFRSF